jgi:hypothetical protein
VGLGLVGDRNVGGFVSIDGLRSARHARETARDIYEDQLQYFVTDTVGGDMWLAYDLAVAFNAEHERLNEERKNA